MCFLVRVGGGKEKQRDEQKSNHSAILFHVNIDKYVQLMYMNVYVCLYACIYM